jgi:hypothetical protein
MKKKNETSVEQNFGLSRRAIIKAASAAAVGLAVGVRADATCQVPTAIDYGSTGSAVPLSDANIYPLLAAWLILTTNGNRALAPSASNLSAVTGLGSTTAQTLINSYYSNCAYASGFALVRQAFQEAAKAFASGTIPYNNGQCPDKADTVTCIAALPCSRNTPK